MKSFKKRVDELLIELDKSEAAPGKVGEDRLPRAQLGSSDFKEAQFLYDSYTLVHDELENLSKALSARSRGGWASRCTPLGWVTKTSTRTSRPGCGRSTRKRRSTTSPDRDPYAQRQPDTSTAPGSDETKEW